MFILNRMFLILIWVYQKTLSAILGGHCSFHPSCSEYARLAMLKYPWYQATFLLLKRVWRCHPRHLPEIDYP